MSSVFRKIFSWEGCEQLRADLVLISGLEQLAAARAMGKEQILAMVLDLEAWLSEIKIPITIDFLTSELIAMSFALKPLIANRQGQRNDLIKLKKDFKKDENPVSLRRKCDEVKVRTNQKMAEMLGFKNKDAFHRALQTCKNGIPALVNALNHKKITFSKAAKISELSPNEQLKSIVAPLSKRRSP